MSHDPARKEVVSLSEATHLWPMKAERVPTGASCWPVLALFKQGNLDCELRSMFQPYDVNILGPVDTNQIFA
jgi:hypothetical protein